MTKKTNIIVTSIVLVLTIALTVFLGIMFTSFRNYQAYFYTDGADEIQKFSKYSPTLEGTIADSNIYVFYGNENVVAVTKPENTGDYNTAESIEEANVVAVSGALEGADQDALQVSSSFQNTVTKTTKDDALNQVKNGTADVAIMAYEDARQSIKNGEVAVCNAVVEKVPSVLVMGGTHPNEPSGQLGATLFLENCGGQVKRGTLYVINEVNKSAYSHSQPQEATSWYYTITLADGSTRTFKYGSRASNTVDQWPTPDVYTHSSGQQLSSSEVRNLNRAYPGSANGTFTERIAYAVTQLILVNDITMEIDLHEASPEYVTINAIICHDDAIDIGSAAQAFVLSSLYNINVEQSPSSMHGLTHRELGDYTYTYAFLCETSNASQGKIRGAFTDTLITYEQPDKFYEYLYSLDQANGTSLIYARPVPIGERVARHVTSILSIIDSFNDSCMTRTVTVASDTLEKRIGEYIGEFQFEDSCLLQVGDDFVLEPLYNDIKENIGSYLKSEN